MQFESHHRQSDVLSTQTDIFGKESQDIMDLNLESFKDKSKQEGLDPKEVISRVMSKAEIKKQAMQSNNRDYMMDFIEEKPVREYSKDHIRDRHLDLNFKKKSGLKTDFQTNIQKLTSGTYKTQETQIMNKTSVSTEEYISDLVSHLKNVWNDSNKRLMSDNRIESVQLNQLN